MLHSQHHHPQASQNARQVGEGSPDAARHADFVWRGSHHPRSRRDVCVHGAEGDECSSDADCDGECVDNVCYDGSEGDRCDRNTDCAGSLRCGVQLCVDGSAGDECSSDADCAADCEADRCL